MDLVVSSREGRVEKVTEILAQPRVNTELTDENGETALIAACNHGHIEIVDALLQCGCNINATTDTGSTALMAAANFNDVEVIETLIRAGADLNMQDENGATALFMASENDHCGVVATLLRAGAEAEADRIEIYQQQWRDHLLDGQAESPKSPDDKQLAENYRMPPTTADTCVMWMMAALSIFYDFSAAVVSIVDVTTDVLVTKEFYEQDKMFFFIFSVVIMVIAHMAFAFLFLILYSTKEWSMKQRGLLWICMIPLSQFVPMFIWIHSFDFEWFKAMLEALELNSEKPGLDAIKPDDDPLMIWIKQKFASHGGFIMEACVEAFPQSILQMISIVVYHEHTTLNVVSVLISMTAVASKSIMLSYNMDRKVFLFNFACFVGDIFNVFAVVAWAFHSENPGSAFADNTLSLIWMWKLFGLAFMIFMFGVLNFRRHIYERHDHLCQDWSDYPKGVWFFAKGLVKGALNQCGFDCGTNNGCWCDSYTSAHSNGRQLLNFQWFCNCGYETVQDACCRYDTLRVFENTSKCFWCDYIFMLLENLIFWPIALSLFLFMASGLFIFSVMAGEIFKLGWFPIMIIGATQNLNDDIPFYRNLFSFLQTSESNKDIKVRLAITNQVFLEKYFEENPENNLRGPDMLELRHRQKKFVAKDPRDVNFTDMHGFNNDNSHDCRDCISMMGKEMCKRDNLEKWSKCECFEHGEDCYFVFCLLPYDVLSALFTVLFPIVAMIITPYDDWTMLQRWLSLIYVGTLFVVISLMFYVYRFFRLSSSIFAPVPARRKRYPVIHQIIAKWKDFASTSIRDIIVRRYFGEIAPIILEFAGQDQHRVYDISWIPPVNWEKAGNIDGSYHDWTHEYVPAGSKMELKPLKSVESKNIYNEGGEEIEVV